MEYTPQVPHRAPQCHPHPAHAVSHHSVNSSQGHRQRCKDLITRHYFNIHVCVCKKVKISIYWISLLKHGSYWPGEHPKRFRVKHTLSEHDTLAQPNTRLQKRVVLHPHSLKANVQLLTLHSSLHQQKDCMMENLSHPKISHLQNSLSTKE